MKKFKKISLFIGGIIIICVVSFFIYLNMGQYQATTEALNTYEANLITYDKYYEFNNNQEQGLIFYPGAKVDPLAYSYLSEVTNANIYLIRPFYNIAFFNSKIATQIMAEQEKEKTWYVAGHSLGGVVASNYAQNNNELIKGVILLGSYPQHKLIDNTIPYLSLYGTHDGVVGDYSEKEQLFDNNSTLLAITGGNHAQFGDYGLQKGDNNSLITKEEQHKFIVKQIEQFINNK
ncbi:MAG: alpha/beta fold hydrolase [Mycoplasmatales bacterium]